jgi:hypothetical protein
MNPQTSPHRQPPPRGMAVRAARVSRPVRGEQTDPTMDVALLPIPLLPPLKLAEGSMGEAGTDSHDVWVRHRYGRSYRMVVPSPRRGVSSPAG